MMFKTRTGGFPIGFRRGWSDWQKDLPALLAWAGANGFAGIDVGGDPAHAQAVAAAGLRTGSADLLAWSDLISPDKGKRDDAVARNAEYAEACAKAGTKNLFAVMLPEDPGRPRSENFTYMVESLNHLSPHLERHGCHVVIEGWPGPGALCCTPEGVRECLAQCPSRSIGLNYDPSHLIRMGIDPIRFLGEFATRVFHVHGKDTEVFPDAVYEYGTEQPATFAKPCGFGAMHWRYTIPGHGVTPWTRVFCLLVAAGYKGLVSIELEDECFNGTEEGEKAGLLAGGQFLSSC